ncbi:hypothetical protein ACHWQZ_G001678 [Mnemiopsis leidyi]
MKTNDIAVRELFHAAQQDAKTKRHVQRKTHSPDQQDRDGRGSALRVSRLQAVTSIQGSASGILAGQNFLHGQNNTAEFGAVDRGSSTEDNPSPSVLDTEIRPGDNGGDSDDEDGNYRLHHDKENVECVILHAVYLQNILQEPPARQDLGEVARRFSVPVREGLLEDQEEEVDSHGDQVVVLLLEPERGDEGASPGNTQHCDQEEGVPGNGVPDKDPHIAQQVQLEEVGLSVGDSRNSDRQDTDTDEEIRDVDKLEKDVADVGFVAVF